MSKLPKIISWFEAVVSRANVMSECLSSVNLKLEGKGTRASTTSVVCPVPLFRIKEAD